MAGNSPGAYEKVPSASALAYLGVDRYLSTLIDARALKTAFEIGLIDVLAAGGALQSAALLERCGMDERGLDLLLSLLETNEVIDRSDATVDLNDAFRSTLEYRDLLETKLDFAGFLLNDFADLFTDLVRDPARFAANARLYQLFDYRRALRDEGDNYRHTRAWMKLTSALSRYEARALLDLHECGSYRRMLDVGGNSGEFALQLVGTNPRLEATVADLPLVCEIGLEHVMGQPGGERIRFAALDLRADELPRDYDLVSFKSMLHDWPEQIAVSFLEKAARSLRPDGTLLIYERLPLQLAGSRPSFSMLPILLFFRSYRDPSVYESQLRALGLTQVERHEVVLDTPFVIMTARRP